MKDHDFYQTHLDRVSRSFAFCIRKLSLPMREWTALSYLLCRVLDTVEDSIWERPADAERQFVELESFLKEVPTSDAVAAWAARFPSSIPQSERALLGDAHALFEDLHGLPEGIRRDIQETVLRMSAGMRHYFAARDSKGALRLDDLREVNRYCYFVAGIVGELLTRLLLASRPDFRPESGQGASPGSRLMRNAFHFGLFLQKINLLKDQRTDETEGRHFIPDRALVLASLRENAVGSIEYLTSLPEDEKGFRTFCAWSLFLGVASLPWIQKAFAQGDESQPRAKISRAETERLLAEIESIVQDNETIRRSFEEYLSLFSGEAATDDIAMLPTAVSPDAVDWFQRLSGGVLDAASLADLRVT